MMMMMIPTQQMMNSFVRKRIMNSPLLQISSLGKNVFITKLPSLQKISLRHCGIKVSFFTTAEPCGVNPTPQSDVQVAGKDLLQDNCRLFKTAENA